MFHYLSVKLFYVLLLIGEPHSEPQKDTLLSINPGLIIWTIIIFVILLILLKKLAWKPLISSLDNRETLIRESVEKAEQLKKDAEKMLNQNKMILEKADEESRKVINEGKEMAEKLRAELISKTNDDTTRMIKQAKAEIEREKFSALNQLKDEIASLAVNAAEKIIEQNLDPAKQKKIVEDFINQIPNSKN
jgi:F-type H+-transporting ATPase subunit b